MQGFGSRVSEFRVWGVGLRFGLSFSVWGAGLRLQDRVDALQSLRKALLRGFSVHRRVWGVRVNGFGLVEFFRVVGLLGSRFSPKP